MGHFLNFGGGPNQLPEPWQNLNVEHDIRKRLRFADGSAAGILAEHVIEHVPYLQAYGFLLECFRVLAPEGILRLAFPDPVRLLAIGLDGFSLGPKADEYAAELAKRSHGEVVRRSRIADRPRAGAGMMLIGWHHQSMWSLHTAAAVLCQIGFRRVVSREYGRGALAEIDGHHKDVGMEMCLLETTILEATK
jgi:SAM-dependent methyltransferase